MYTKKPPSYDAVQWNGSNAADVEARLLEGTSAELHVGTKVVDGWLIITLQYGNEVAIPPNGWLVGAPSFGPGPHSLRYGLSGIITDEDFQAQYTEI